MVLREDFCGVCAAIPIALAGAGAMSYTMSGKEYNNRRTLTLIGGAIFIVVSVYLLIKYSKCQSCK